MGASGKWDSSNLAANRVASSPRKRVGRFPIGNQPPLYSPITLTSTRFGRLPSNSP